MSDRVTRVISDVLGVHGDGISDEDSPETIPSWDSMAHLNLVMALEAEFAISLSPDDAVEMLSVAAIKDTLTRLGV